MHACIHPLSQYFFGANMCQHMNYYLVYEPLDLCSLNICRLRLYLFLKIRSCNMLFSALYCLIQCRNLLLDLVVK